MKAWDDWLPGVLSQRQLRSLSHSGFLQDAQISGHEDPSDPTIDLRLADAGFLLREGAMKPSRDEESFLGLLARFGTPLNPESPGVFRLEAKKTYAFKIKERIGGLKNTPIHGQATAKSSIGRMDVLARLIVDGMDRYEGFDPGVMSTGEMFLEITPLTFSVRVKVGTSLSQLRLFMGRPEASEVTSREHWRCVIDDEHTDGTLSVDLTDAAVRNLRAAAFCASDDPTQVIDLWRLPTGAPDPCHFWRLLKASEKPRRLVIRKNCFYILRSKERIAVPKGLAVYCRAIDETIGEMRIHYAGFAHPYFGLARTDDQKGTPLIFEVRGHDVDVNLMHGERMARLILYRMSEDAERPKSPSYNDQVLNLSSIFAPWPDRLVLVNDEGHVAPATEQAKQA